MGACASTPSVQDASHHIAALQKEKNASIEAGHAQKDLAAGRPQESIAVSDARTSESTVRMSDELMALPADKHANHCYDSASSHPGRSRSATALNALTPKGADTPKGAGRGGGFRGEAGPPRGSFWPTPESSGQGAASPQLEPAASLQTVSSMASRSSQELVGTEGFVFETMMPMSPFERNMGAQRERQRLSLDAVSLQRQSSTGMTFERKQQVNRRYSLAVDNRGSTLERQASGVVQDVQKAAQAGIERILGLCKSIFRVDSVLVHLRDGDVVFARPGDTTFGEEQRRTACAKLAPPDGQAAVCEDPASDARLKDAPDVTAALRFFAGSPLVAPNGFRLGSMCLLHSQAMQLSAANMAILKNMSDLMTREVWGAYEDSYKKRVLQLKKVTDCYSEPHIFVEVSDLQPWMIISFNVGALKTIGMEGKQPQNEPFWDMFQRVSASSGQRSRSWAEKASKGAGFALTNMKRKDNPSPEPVTFTLNFRPAARELITQGSETRPRPVSNAGRHCYFVGIRVEATAPLTSAIERTPFVGLQLGQMLGKGAYGRVYKGYYHGKVVAVKVCSSCNLRCNQEGVPVEAFLKDHLQHPQLVRLLDSATAQRGARLGRADSSTWQSGGVSSRSSSIAFEESGDGYAERSSQLEMETWLLLEYCDMGTLMDAVGRAYFRSCPKGPANMMTVLSVAIEIAAGMSYLHDRGIIHGDLSAGNILLATTSMMPHGFSAKVSDFGMAREMDIQSKIATATTGTVTYMPPETIADGMVSKAADVYAFGVLLWEMLSSERAWHNLTPPQIMVAVTCQNRTLDFPSWTMHDIAKLGRQCMSKDPRDRPTFEDVSRALKHMLSKLMRANSNDLANFRLLSCP